MTSESCNQNCDQIPDEVMDIGCDGICHHKDCEGTDKHTCHDLHCEKIHFDNVVYSIVPGRNNRVTGRQYLQDGVIKIWNGKVWHCEHNRRSTTCKSCLGVGICEHNKRKSRCLFCGGSELCQHGKPKSICALCEGKSICEHEKLRTLCKMCGGGSLCQHGRKRSECKECKGGSICEHNRRRTECRECKGGGLCEHNRRRCTCKDCKGGGICEHNRIRSSCKDCHGGSICEHNIFRSKCRSCGGGGICEHDRVRSRCKDCGGGSICEHNRIRSSCKDCHGGSICEHDHLRSKCKRCDGGSFCEHKKIRSECKECGGRKMCQHQKEKGSCFYCSNSKNKWCVYCKIVWVSRYKPYCFHCYCFLHPDDIIPRRFMMKENYVHDWLKSKYPNIIHNHKIVGGESLRRPDWFIDLKTHVLVMENNENQHVDYSCEDKRMMELFVDARYRPLIMIRFNCDGYIDKNGKKHQSCFYFDDKNKIFPLREELDVRMKIFLDVIHNAHHMPVKEVTMIELFYNGFDGTFVIG